MSFRAPHQKHPVELREDGSIAIDGKPALRFVGAELRKANGTVIASVAADGAVATNRQSITARFDEKDELVLGNGGKISIADTGLVRLFDDDGHEEHRAGNIRIEGFQPTARRAATLFVFTMLTVVSPTPWTATHDRANPTE